MHFYESSIITTTDGMHAQVYCNEHPTKGILVKPKYIPTDKIECSSLPYRFISGKKMNRLNLWIDKKELKEYFSKFAEAYPDYIFRGKPYSDDRWFFIAPIDKIERVYFPRRGLAELMGMPRNALDAHLVTVRDFIDFLIKSGLTAKDLGITYSTLMGHYASSVSDINIVVYGKHNFWKLMDFLKSANHELLRWKTDEDWMAFHKGRNRFEIFSKEEFLDIMRRKPSEGYFNNTLFVIFGVEEENETWFRWGEEEFETIGTATVEGEVADNFSSVVRPGMYGIKNSKVLDGKNIPVSKVVFYSRDYCMIAQPGERIRACGILEKVTPKDKSSKQYYRLVVGYFDAYVTERREKEYIKRIK